MTAGPSLVVSNTINLNLPIAPPAPIDDALFNQLLIIYNALRQLQNGTDKYLDTPDTPNLQGYSGSYTIQYTDRGQFIDWNNNITIPQDNTILPFPVGMTVGVTNIAASNISIIPASGVTLILAGTGGSITGTRTLTPYGMATLRRLTSNTWIIIGAGLS